MKTVIATALSLSLLLSGMAFAAPLAGPQSRPGTVPAHTMPAPARAATPAPASKATPAPVMQHHVAPAPKAAAKAPAATQQHRAHRKGERLQTNHRGVPVTNLHGKGLRAPARGQEWRQLEGKYLLISSATGLIIDIITARR